MKNLYRFLLLISFLIPFDKSTHAQNYSEQGKLYFSNYLSTASMTDLISKSLPTLDDCKLIFKGKYAYTYYGMLEEAKIELAKYLNQESKSFEDLNLNAFSTQDIELGQAKYASGILKENLGNLQPYVIFYELEFLKTKGDTAGSSYKYWVNVNGRWVFISHKLL